MAEITVALISKLRQQTSAGMMDCKKALTENDGDYDAAVDWLRKKGAATAAKKLLAPRPKASSPITFCPAPRPAFSWR